MTVALRNGNETQRLDALYHYEILDTDTEASFNEIVEVAAQVCETKVAMISLVDHNRQWLKAKLGLQVNEGPRLDSFCNAAIQQEEKGLVVPDALQDSRFTENRFVKEFGVRSYAGMPLRTHDGYNLGSLCVVDFLPRELSPVQLNTLRVLANQAMRQIELRKRNLDAARVNDRNLKMLSIIGHDVRSPLNELANLMKLVSIGAIPGDQFSSFTEHINQSLNGANVLVNNLLEWSASQFAGNDVPLSYISLDELLYEVIDGHRAVFKKKGNHLLVDVQGGAKVFSNTSVIQFVLRNVLANANKFTSNGCISISHKQSGNSDLITVQDNGIGMKEANLKGLFNWSVRKVSKGTDGESGSGIGLNLCREFLEKIGGSIEVLSIEGQGTTVQISLRSGARTIL